MGPGMGEVTIQGPGRQSRDDWSDDCKAASSDLRDTVKRKTISDPACYWQLEIADTIRIQTHESCHCNLASQARVRINHDTEPVSEVITFTAWPSWAQTICSLYTLIMV